MKGYFKIFIESIVFVVSILFLTKITYAQEAYSGAGNWLELDGVNDYASIADNSSLDIGTGAADDFTIECFFYIPDLDGNSIQELIYGKLRPQAASW